MGPRTHSARMSSSSQSRMGLLGLGGMFYALPPVAAVMLRETLAGRPEAVIECISAEFDVGAEQVRADLDTFLADLQRKRLIQRRPGTERQLGSRAWWARRAS